MRAFMRAIGLGGLFRSSRREAKNQQRRAGGPAMCPLVPVDEIALAMPDASRASARITETLPYGRRSSNYERPQFLFFCGSDNSGISASRRTGYSAVGNASSNVAGTSHNSKDNKTPFTFNHVEMPSPVSGERIRAPQISHRIPVFFAPQHSMMHFE